jgi:hypothetical protein
VKAAPAGFKAPFIELTKEVLKRFGHYDPAERVKHVQIGQPFLEFPPEIEAALEAVEAPKTRRTRGPRANYKASAEQDSKPKRTSEQIFGSTGPGHWHNDFRTITAKEPIKTPEHRTEERLIELGQKMADTIRERATQKGLGQDYINSRIDEHIGKDLGTLALQLGRRSREVQIQPQDWRPRQSYTDREHRRCVYPDTDADGRTRG